MLVCSPQGLLGERQALEGTHLNFQRALLRLSGLGEGPACWLLGSAELDSLGVPLREGLGPRGAVAPFVPGSREPPTSHLDKWGAMEPRGLPSPVSAPGPAYLEHLSVLTRIRIERILQRLYL